MKVVPEKSFRVDIAVPETKEEAEEMRRIIHEIETDSELKNPKNWIKIKAGKPIQESKQS